MSAGDARHGRRDNGLVAAEYAAAGDVDPRVGEHLLDVLALDGIAAYLRPSTDLHPVTRSSTLPGRPTDRLYVDRIHLATARDYLDRLAEEPDGATALTENRAAQAVDARADGRSDATLDAPADPDPRIDLKPGDLKPGDRKPGDLKAGDLKPGDLIPGAGDEPNIDAEWARIVAGFDTEVELPGRSWPAAEDLPEEHRTPLFPSRDDQRGQRPPVERFTAQPPREESSLLDGLDTFGASLPDADEDGYEPPTPPPVPRPSAPTALAVAGIILGLIVFLKPSLLSIVSESVAMLAGFTAVVGGFATLVWRLRPGDDEDIDPDDGARV